MGLAKIARSSVVDRRTVNLAPRIGVFGHYGNENLGDETIIAAVIQNVMRRWPDATVAGFSINPADTAQRHGIAAYPIRRGSKPLSDKRGSRRRGHGPAGQAVAVPPRPARIVHAIKKLPLLPGLLRAARELLRRGSGIVAEAAFLWQSYRRLRGMDMLLVAGSNQFLDNFGGPWGFPYTLLKWSILARLTNTRLAYLSVGAGPISRPLSSLFIKHGLRKADYVSCRDTGSSALLARLKIAEHVRVAPDLAFSVLQPTPDAFPRRTGNALKRTIGINIMPVHDPRYWPIGNDDKYDAYVRKAGALASRLATDGYDVFFFGTQRADYLTINDALRVMVDNASGHIEKPAVRRSDSLDELMNVLSAADIIVASRFHGVVLGLYAEKPVLALCYQSKTEELMRDMGQGDYALPLDTFDVDDAVTRLHRLDADHYAQVRKVAARKAAYAKALQDQYAQVFELSGRTA